MVRTARGPLSVLLAVPLLTAQLGCSGARARMEPGIPADLPPAAFLARSHAHDDYSRRPPLVEALERGFASIEVDVVLLDGELYLAHGPRDVRTGYTLERFYLEPLRELAVRNGGTIHGASDPPLQLLVDVKSEAEATYAVLSRVLDDYSNMLTRWTDTGVEPGAVSVVISGNRPLGMAESGSVRHAGLDGRVYDDRGGFSSEAMPLVSANWEELASDGPEEALARAADLAERMHSEGRKVRFWGTPEDERLWRALLSVGVDYIGTDDPERLEVFLRALTRP